MGLLTNLSKKREKWWTKYILMPLIFLLVIAIIFIIVFKVRHNNTPISYGVSFSKPYAMELGINWQDTYIGLIDDMGIKKLRLMSYWDQHEPTPDVYDFSDLDWQFEQAKKYNAKITLAIGVRQPRWPECHEPEWAKALPDAEWENQLIDYLARVVNRYKHHPSLSSWQLENEFGNVDFGSNCRDFSRQRLLKEFELVKELDNSHPIIMSMSNQVGIPLSKPHPDVYGFSVYRRVFEGRFLKRYISHPIPASYHSLRAQIVEIIHKKPVIIHELQAEPWTRRKITETDISEQQQTMSTKHLRSILNFAANTGIKTQYLWGGEWWYHRKTIHNDSSYWDIIKEALGSND